MDNDRMLTLVPCALLQGPVVNRIPYTPFAPAEPKRPVLPPDPRQPQVCSLHLWVCFCFLDKSPCVIFSIPHTSDIIQCLSFSVWCTSLRVRISLSIHVAANGILLFFLRDGALGLSFLSGLLWDSSTSWVWEPLGCSGCLVSVYSALPTKPRCPATACGRARVFSGAWRRLWGRCPNGGTQPPELPATLRESLGLEFLPAPTCPITLSFQNKLKHHTPHGAHPAGWVG